VPPQARALLDQAVAHPGCRAIERGQDLIDRVAPELVPPLDAGEQAQQ
jgi:hypothetical protein